MEVITSPYLLDLQFRGFIEGLTLKSKSSGTELCHYFGGIPYALPPVGSFRWCRPRPLAPCYRYGTRASPANCTGNANVCPQPQGSNSDDEDCLQSNIWVPAGQAPTGGWPVYFYIHGGFLQIGTANAGSGDPTSLLAETSFKAIVIKPAFRLNIFGFLASKELLTEPTNTGRTVGNLGFWDLRLALEWTHKNISYFSGNPSNITIGGYSAGAHAAFYQLAYDMESPPEKRIVKRIIMHSQGPGVQPRSLEEVQLQFDELLEVLNIPQSLSSKEKLRRLRAMSTRTLLAAIPMRKMRYHQFRAVTDGVFVRNTLFKDIITGDFARRMLESNICLLTGECSDEHFVYGRYRAPADDYNSVVTRLVADYPKKNVGALAKHYFPGEKLPQEHKRWKEAFGKVYADVQIHATQRGFVDGIIRGGAGKLVHRYRIEWRSKLADRSWPREWGATHGADQIIWFWGNGRELDDGEKAIIKDAFIEQFAAFIKGDAVEWGTDDPHRVRRLSADGTVDICRDEFRDEKLKVWHALQDATFKPFEPKASL